MSGSTIKERPLRETDNSTFSDILSQLDVNHQRAILRTRDSLSSWLNVLPTTKDNFDLSCSEFRDARIILICLAPNLGMLSASVTPSLCWDFPLIVMDAILCSPLLTLLIVRRGSGNSSSQ